MTEQELKEYVRNHGNWETLAMNEYERTSVLHYKWISVYRQDISEDGCTWRKKRYYYFNPARNKNVVLSSVNEVVNYLKKQEEMGRK